MNNYQLIGMISGLLAFIAYVPYFVSIIKKKTTAHPVSWVLWAIIGFVSLVTYWAAGGRETIWIAVVAFFCPPIIMILSLKFWSAGLQKFDYVCIFLSAVSMVIWLVSGNAVIALTFNIIADILATSPTILKTYHDPGSEDYLFWSVTLIANVLNLFAIRYWSYSVAILPVYFAFVSGTITTLIFRKKFFI